MQVIVVDNASSDGSAEMVRADFPEVELLPEAHNHGYARGNNLAMARASGEWLLTLNPDTEVYGGTLDNAVEVLRAHPKHGVLGVRQVGPKGEVQQSVRGFPTFMGILGDLTGLGRMLGGAFDSYRLTRFDYAKEQDAPQPMGTFLLFRRQALLEVQVGEELRPFDESFPIFFNEVDLLYRLSKKGWRALYTPEVSIKHHGGESTKQVRKSMIWESHKSLGRFFGKHRPGLLTPLLRAMLWLSAFVRARGYHRGFQG